MTRGMIYKSLFIIALIILSIILILPTMGSKRMEITFLPDATSDQIGSIEKRFPSGDYSIEKKDSSLIVKSYNITDAVMNEMRTYPGVKDAVILPHWAQKAVLAKKITLGLDLQGGMHLVMMADFDKIRKRLITQKDILLEKKKTLEESKKKNPNDSNIKDEIEIVENELKDINERKLDGSDGLQEKYKNEVTQQALELIRNRVDKFGVAEPSIRPRGNEAIEIQLPGVKDPNSVKNAIGTTGRVEYRLVDDEYTKNAHLWLSKNYNKKGLPDTPEALNDLAMQISEGIKLPANFEVLYLYQRGDKSKNIYPTDIMVLERQISLAGDDIARAWVGQDDYGGLTVQFTTTPEGASKFARVTEDRNKGRRLAILIDDKIRSAPRINEQIATGRASITGDFTLTEVKTLANIIQEGALPVDLTIAEERTVGPSLGQDAIEKGLRAMIVGLAGVMAFMIFYYKIAGLIADIGIILNAIFMLALLSWLGFTLTMPGIAGFILTIGMAVDANVIIYERMKEEVRSGKSVRMSVTMGFDRAFWAIFDSNLTTLIAAFVMAWYGTGPVRGFAVSLFAGVICSMFVALYITRFIYEIMSSSMRMKKLSI